MCWVEVTMKTRLLFLIATLIACFVCYAPVSLCAQDAKSSGDKQADKAPTPPNDAEKMPSYSGTYSFLKEGEFLQLTVEDAGSVTGYISRFGDGESDKGAFLDQFFKTGKLDGSKLTFTTDVVHGVAFDFRGSVERGDGKNPGDEGYFVLKGTLTENVTDANKKVTPHPRPVLFKIFPQYATPAPVERK